MKFHFDNVKRYNFFFYKRKDNKIYKRCLLFYFLPSRWIIRVPINWQITFPVIRDYFYHFIETALKTFTLKTCLACLAHKEQLKWVNSNICAEVATYLSKAWGGSVQQACSFSHGCPSWSLLPCSGPGTSPCPTAVVYRSWRSMSRSSSQTLTP